MSNEQEQQVVGIEEALAEGYAIYSKTAHSQMFDMYGERDFAYWTQTQIRPRPEWLREDELGRIINYANSLAEFYRLIKNADMKTAEEIAKRIEQESRGTIMSFESFVKDLINTCECYGDIEDVQEEDQGE